MRLRRGKMFVCIQGATFPSIECCWSLLSLIELARCHLDDHCFNNSHRETKVPLVEVGAVALDH